MTNTVSQCGIVLTSTGGSHIHVLIF